MTVRALLRWHREAARPYPWRSSQDPYELLITELMLVRTRADQVARVWPAFFERFPTMESLSAANGEEVSTALRPLGLVWRSDRIVELARAASSVESWQSMIHELPGGGPYVTAAVTIGMRGRGRLPVDVTIARVITRYYDIAAGREPRRSPRVLKRASDLGGVSRGFFHAILDLAALVCLPTRPRCGHCPIRSGCATGSSQPDVAATASKTSSSSS